MFQVPVEYIFRAARTPQAHIGHSTWSCPKMWGGGAPHPTGPPPHQCESLYTQCDSSLCDENREYQKIEVS